MLLSVLAVLAALALVDDVRVRDASDRAAAELHLVAGERARLVAEDVFDLSEFFHETRCATQCGRVRAGVVHIEIRIDELRLLKLDDLHGDDERDGDQVVIQDNKGKDIYPPTN